MKNGLKLLGNKRKNKTLSFPKNKTNKKIKNNKKIVKSKKEKKIIDYKTKQEFLDEKKIIECLIKEEKNKKYEDDQSKEDFLKYVSFLSNKKILKNYHLDHRCQIYCKLSLLIEHKTLRDEKANFKIRRLIYKLFKEKLEKLADIYYKYTLIKYNIYEEDRGRR